ncbi:MAG: hypothetical protein C4518_08485 [Desulfobacteraceae bacterium]|nr:MAG: hypothetical protein C4518_08485 [Desulfobacteraceae bacterium]
MEFSEIAGTITRNIDCPYYGRCLDHEAKKDSNGWNCEGCRYEQEKDDQPETDFSEYYILLWAIFKPNLYAEYNATKKFNPENIE